ncbi:hypothetical protein ACF1AO_31375 [Streptomyces longwoodensis]
MVSGRTGRRGPRLRVAHASANGRDGVGGDGVGGDGVGGDGRPSLGMLDP